MIERFKKAYAMGELLDSTFTKDAEIEVICEGIAEYTLVIYTIAFCTGVVAIFCVIGLMVIFL